MDTPTSPTPAPAAPAPEPTPPAETKEQKAKRRMWDIIITATPVLLTVLATALASKSAAEMTQAQYHRAVAAQNQSKAGDQWAFFQAKKVRSTIQTLKAERGAFSEKDLRLLADRLPESLKRLGDEARDVLAQLDRGPADQPGPKGNGTALKEAVLDLQKAADKAARDAEKTKKEIADLLSKKEVESALPYLSGGNLPLPANADPKANPFVVVAAAVKEVDPDILEVEKDIRGRKPRAEYEPKLKKLDRTKLRQAIEAAEAKAGGYDTSSDPAGDAYKELDKALAKERDLLRPVTQAADEVRGALDLQPRSQDKEMNGVRQRVAELADFAERVGKAARGAGERFTAAKSDFEFRRYDREGKFNQAIASLYEVQVHKSAYDSDSAMHRKDMYMYGMLAAQAGVAVATFALAVRFKGVLWALAAVAGVIAIFLMGMGMGLLGLVGMAQ